MVTDLTEAIDAGDHALLGLLDISAAFDTVDYDVLAERLSKTHGTHSTALDWLHSYRYMRSPTDDPLRRGLLYRPLSLLWRPSGRCCSCSTPPILVRLLRVSVYHLTSTPMTLSFTRGALHRQFHSSGVAWNLVLSGSPNGCVPTDCDSTPRRRTSCGAQPADGISILTPVS